MQSQTWQSRRGELKTYFDRTAVEAWARLTSNAPVSRIRATVRAGRDSMRANLLGWLPDDLHGRRILDAGCGTGALAVEAARRGADVVAIDLSPTLVKLAAERSATLALAGRLDFRVGDMAGEELGQFDHVVAMDSLIHYEADDMVAAVARLAARARHSLLFTFAPRTPALTAMHWIGRAFPRGDRAPAIEPVALTRLERLIGNHPDLAQWKLARDYRVGTGFYISHALELACEYKQGH